MQAGRSPLSNRSLYCFQSHPPPPPPPPTHTHINMLVHAQTCSVYTCTHTHTHKQVTLSSTPRQYLHYFSVLIVWTVIPAVFLLTALLAACLFLCIIACPSKLVLRNNIPEGLRAWGADGQLDHSAGFSLGFCSCVCPCLSHFQKYAYAR